MIGSKLVGPGALDLKFDHVNRIARIDAPVLDAQTLTRLGDGQLQLSLSVPGAVQATVLGSTNLTDWTALGTVPLIDGSAVFTDDTAPNYSTRFYRLRVP